MEKFWGDYRDGVGKSGVLEHISGLQHKYLYLKRVKIEEKLLWRNSQRSFERYHLRSPTASSSPIFGIRNPHSKLQSLLSRKRVKLQIWRDYSQGPSEQKSIKIFGVEGAWAYPGTAQIFSVPQLSQERVKLRTSSLAGTFTGSTRTKSH